jgi:menaquinone-dependent protoporphyrinogen oxidase
MTVLVAAASKHGATDEIAARIGADLVEHGLDVEVKRLEDVRDVGGYDACVLGSGVYLGNWLKEARRFIDTHAAELAQRPTWLFASGSIVGDPPLADDQNALRAGLAERLVATTQAREHKLFAGKLDMSTLGLAERTAGADGTRPRGRLARVGRSGRVGSRDRGRADNEERQIGRPGMKP